MAYSVNTPAETEVQAVDRWAGWQMACFAVASWICEL